MDNLYYRSSVSGKLIPVRVRNTASGEAKVRVFVDWTRTRAQSYEHCRDIFHDFVASVGTTETYSFLSHKDEGFEVFWGELRDADGKSFNTVPEERKVQSKMETVEADSNLELLRDVLDKLESARYTVQDFDMNVAHEEATFSATLKKEEA